MTKDARKAKDGKRPAVLYCGAQHAREWITPEMVRRLMHYYLDGYGADPEHHRLLKSTELWFVPVANPDGYDYTFSTDRLWRKNLRDNNGDGQITATTASTPTATTPTKWGWDNEGSSTDPAERDLPRPGPDSEPETQALDRAARPGRVRVPHQLPLRCRAAALRRRLAGQHAVARRRHL